MEENIKFNNLTFTIKQAEGNKDKYYINADMNDVNLIELLEECTYIHTDLNIYVCIDAVYLENNIKQFIYNKKA